MRKPISKRRRSRRRGFTLIELLVVVTILGLIAGIVGVATYNNYVDAQIKTTKIQISKLGEALDMFRLKQSRFPTTAEGLAVLTKPPSGRPIMLEVPKDPWNSEYIYTFPGETTPNQFSLFSKGPDGVAGTEDDIR